MTPVVHPASYVSALKLSTPMQVALRRAAGERHPDWGVSWRAGVSWRTWMALERRGLVDWDHDTGWITPSAMGESVIGELQAVDPR
jgi:hypothetical protein